MAGRWATRAVVLLAPGADSDAGWGKEGRDVERRMLVVVLGVDAEAGAEASAPVKRS